MKIWQLWFYTFCSYYTLVDIFMSVLHPEESRVTETIIQSAIFSTLLIAFLKYWKDSRSKNQE